MYIDCPTVAMTPSEVLDAPTLSKLQRLDPSGQSRLVQRVLTVYQQSLGRLKAQIADGLDPRDLGAVQMGAHTLKSSSASIGALRLSALCATVERSIRDGCTEPLDGLIEQLQVEMEHVDEAVASLLAHPVDHS